MTKLVSGRVEKISSANVSADRYHFLSLQETEPDLGLPISNGQVLASNTDGQRFFITLNTDNISEGGNLYYTNARVDSRIAETSINALSDIDVTGVANGYIIQWNSDLNKFVASDLARATAANVANLVLTLENFTTSNIAEGSNLYYTNTRVSAYISESDITTQNLTVAGNLIVQGETTTLNVANLIVEDKNILLANGALDASTADGGGITIEGANASIIYRETGDKFLVNKNVEITGNIVVNGTLIGNITGISAQTETLDNFTTSNLAEGTNLYYTNARVDSRISETSVNALSDIDVTGVANGYIIQWNSDLNKFVASDLARATAANVANLVLTLENFTTSNIAEGSNLYYTNARVYSNVAPLLEVKANIVDLTTSNVVELNNLYYTNARVDSRIADTSVNALSDVDITGISNNDTLSWDGTKFVPSSPGTAPSANVANTVLTISNFDTGDLAEGENLYYTNTRVRSAISAGDGSILYNPNDGTIRATGFVTTANISYLENLVANLTTSNIAEGSNLYYTNARVIAYLNEINFLDSFGGNLVANITTSNVAEGTNLYYTNARVYSNIVPLLEVKANVADLTTSNVVELNNLYYTNTRVYSNVEPVLVLKANVVDLTTSNVVELDNLYFTNVRVYSNIAPLLEVKANVVDLTTSNVVELDNLYFTNARAQGAIVAGNNIVIGPNGLISVTDTPIFSDTEVADLIITGNLVMLGNATIIQANVLEIEDPIIHIAANNETSDAIDFGFVGHYSPDAGVTRQHAGIFRKHGTDTFYVFSEYVDAALDIGQLVTNIDTANASFRTAKIAANVFIGNLQGNVIGLTTDRIPEGANLYYTNSRVEAYVDTLGYIKGIDLTGNTTTDLAEGINLYYTNARVYSNVAPLLELKANIVDLTTSNVVELNNLYYTNTRVYSNVAPLLEVKANVVDLTTSNVVELNNLYYTNARVYSNIVPLLEVKANVVDLTTSNVIELNNLYYTNARVYSNVAPLLEVKANVVDLTTSNVVELNNLYYTNARVYSNVAPLLEVKANIVDLTTSNVVELNNLYYTNTRVYSNVAPLLELKANVTDLTTSNVIELNNLYYTNARVLSHISESDITTQNLTVAGNLLVQGSTVTLNASTISVEDKNILLANGAINASAADGAGITIDGAQANITYIASGDKFAINKNLEVLGYSVLTYNNTTTDLAEGSNLYYTNARVDAYINDNIDTSDIDEGINLYYTNARVYSNIVPLLEVKANVTDLTTSNVVELNNLYYTNTRVYSNVAPLLEVKANVVDLTTSNVVELNNLYYTNARVYSNVAPLLELKANVTDLTTSNVVELNNLYYTNARVLSNISQSDITTQNLTVAGNLIATENVTAKSFITTGVGTPSLRSQTNIGLSANGLNGGAVVIENSTLRLKSYTTVDRNANITPAAGDLIYNDTTNIPEYYNGTGWISLDTENASFANTSNISNLVLSLDNLTTSNLSEGSNLYYTNTRVLSILAESNVLVGNLISIDTIQGNTLVIRGINVANQALLGDVSGGSFSGNSLVVDYVSSNTWANLYTANIIESNQNLFYTNSRVRSAISAGDGINIQNGTISAAGIASEFSLSVDGVAYQRVTDSMSPILDLVGTPANTRVILRSFHVTNISEDAAYISAQVQYGDSNVTLFNQFPVPVGIPVELVQKKQIFNSGATLKLQGFNSLLQPTGNVIDASISYDTSNDVKFNGYGVRSNVADSNVTIYQANTSYALIESIKIVNSGNSIAKIRLGVADSTGNVQSFFAYNTQIPINTLVEIITGPKRIEEQDTLVFLSNSNSEISIFISERAQTFVDPISITTSVLATSNILGVFSTQEPNGSTLHYSLE